MALAYRLDAISQGPKKSRFPGPNPLPLALVMDAALIKKHYARGRINHRSKKIANYMYILYSSTHAKYVYCPQPAWRRGKGAEGPVSVNRLSLYLCIVYMHALTVVIAPYPFTYSLPYPF